MQEKLAQTKARSNIGNHQQSWQSRQTKKENSEEPDSRQDSNHLNPVPQAEQEKNKFYSKKNIVDALCHLVKQQSQPDIKLAAFDGNSLDFHYFMILFCHVVQKRIDGPRGRLVRVLKYMGRDTKEMIKHCIQEPPTMDYQNAKKILGEEFGIHGIKNKEIE